jgi:hypothetical protein
MDPDLRVREAIGLVFTRFAEMQSIRQVFLSLRGDQIALPYINSKSSGQHQLLWKLPVYATVNNLLTNHDGKAIGHLLERNLGCGLHALGGELGFAENQRQSHREASGMGRADEFLGIGAGLALEPAAEAIGIVLQRAALCGDGAFTILDSAMPDG